MVDRYARATACVLSLASTLLACRRETPAEETASSVISTSLSASSLAQRVAITAPTMPSGEAAPSPTEGATRAGASTAQPPAVSWLNPEGKWSGPARLVEQLREGDFGRRPQGTALARESLRATALETVCGERAPCRPIADHDAGRDQAQRRQQVIGISLTAETYSAPSVPGDSCEPIEYWLVVSEQRRVVAAELLLAVCNDGYGAAGVGEDDVEVGENHFTHRQSGGSAWRWYDEVTLQLSPRRVAALAAGTYWSAGFNRGDSEWDWRSFRGKETEAVPPCGSDGSPPDAWDDSFESSWIAIPAAAVSPAFARGAWKTAHLGQCAARVTGSGGDGFVTYGQHDGANDATLRVVGLHDGSLLIEVSDDHFVFDAARPLYEDHVELWAASGTRPSPADFCFEKDERKAAQWGVRLKDGAIFAGLGAPPAGAWVAESLVRDGSVMMKVTPKAAHESITVVYSDSDDGKTQSSLIATSRLRHGEVQSLGMLSYIHPAAAHCELLAGALEPVLE